MPFPDDISVETLSASEKAFHCFGEIASLSLCAHDNRLSWHTLVSKQARSHPLDCAICRALNDANSTLLVSLKLEFAIHRLDEPICPAERGESGKLGKSHLRLHESQLLALVR